MHATVPFLDADLLRKSTTLRHLELHECLGSTNDRAAELARELSSAQLPALIAARVQTAGRGRGKNVWWSSDGALTFSLLIDSAAIGISPASWPQLSLATAVAVCDALQADVSGVVFGIKWPNDVFAAGRKVGGILIESPGGTANRLIIGIGINVNTTWQHAPSEVRKGGISLSEVSDQPHSRSVILANVLDAIDRRTRQLREADAELVNAWQRLNILAGRRVCVEAANGRVQGTCLEIGGDGALVLATPTGREHFHSGSIVSFD